MYNYLIHNHLFPMKTHWLIFVGIFFFALASLCLTGRPSETLAASQLIKGKFSAAIYELVNGKRYAFPNEKVFFTWHKNFSEVQTITDKALAEISLAGNVTYRPGVKMIKIVSIPKVYAVTANATLRWITTEALARAYYGADWQKQVHDVSDAFFTDYSVGAPLVAATDFNPADESNQNQIFTPLAPPLNKSTISCGNGIIDAAEDCDGGQHCSSACKLVTVYPSTDYSAPGGYTDYTAGVDDKIAIGDGINLRIDDVTAQKVRYSIWGKDTDQTCKLLSAAGEFTLDAEFKFREFTDSFFEVLGIGATKISLRQWYGQQARVRCEAIAGWKKDLACSFYPADDRAYVSYNNVQTFYLGAQARLAAEYYTEAFSACYQRYLKKIPGLASVRPIGRQHWDIYQTTGDANAYSADYQRIFVPTNLFNVSVASLQQKLTWTKDTRCPIEETAIVHEMAHLLFSRTFLQDIYDGGYKSEWPYHAGSVTPSEGFAQFIAHYVTKDMPDKTGIDDRAFWSAFCGDDRLINAHPDGAYSLTAATESQMRYSEILNGHGYKANHYQAGYCFYKRINADCGDAGIDDLLAKAIQYDGSMASHPSLFSYLAINCGEAKVKAIMTDFGFDHALLNMTQRWPNTDFPNNLHTPGCL